MSGVKVLHGLDWVGLGLVLFCFGFGFWVRLGCRINNWLASLYRLDIIEHTFESS